MAALLPAQLHLATHLTTQASCLVALAALPTQSLQQGPRLGTQAQQLGARLVTQPSSQVRLLAQYRQYGFLLLAFHPQPNLSEANGYISLSAIYFAAFPRTHLLLRQHLWLEV